MNASGTQAIIDYTTVPSGLRIEGQIWTGQATTNSTAQMQRAMRFELRSLYRLLPIPLPLGGVRGGTKLGRS